jgi:uncharacterized repeat protein (TIGR03803 family)
MTAEGGSGSSDPFTGNGVIFEWDPASNVFINKKDFIGTDGDGPSGSLTFANGKFYGMTFNGGNSDKGVIFEWDPASNVYTKKKDFIGIDGSTPTGSLTFANGKFYGMTNGGGSSLSGVIFEWEPVNNAYTKKKDFSDSDDGVNPSGTLTYAGGKFYGMTSSGGISGYGVIFEWDPATNVYSKKKEFNGVDGAYPRGSLTFANGKVYGMTNYGGSSDKGVIFEWDPTNNVYTKKKDFNNTDGSYPLGSLTFANSKFYGMTNGGGSSSYGVIFEWDPITNDYVKKKEFNRPDGFNPGDKLTYAGGKFYGVTNSGGMVSAGSSGYGVLFEWDPASNAYTKKKEFSFTDGDGSYPSGGLTYSNGKFYGITTGGGSNYDGVIFEWDPASNVYTKKMEFNSSDGRYPTGSLTYSNGKFYGMTDRGGSNNLGVIFEWDPVTNVYTKKADFNGTNGAYPQYTALVLYDCPAISLSPTTVPNDIQGTAYNQTLSASGGAGSYTFSLKSGSTLPSGLSLSSDSLSGTPTTSGSFSFTIVATDANGCSGERTYSLTVACPAISLNPTSLPAATQGTSYSQTLSASGGSSPYTFALKSGSTLPAGLTLSGANLSGTPTALGNFSFTIEATDAGGCKGERTYSLTIACPTSPATPITITQNGSSSVLSSALSLQSNYTSGNQWIKDNQPIAGATNPTYQVTQAGTYSLQVTINGCVYSSSPLVVTANEPALEEGLSVYPNPIAVGQPLNVSLKAAASELPLARVYNLFGAQVGQVSLSWKNGQWTGSLNTQALAVGYYQLVITTSKSKITRAFVCQ